MCVGCVCVGCVVCTYSNPPHPPTSLALLLSDTNWPEKRVPLSRPLSRRPIYRRERERERERGLTPGARPRPCRLTGWRHSNAELAVQGCFSQRDFLYGTGEGLHAERCCWYWAPRARSAHLAISPNYSWVISKHALWYKCYNRRGR